MKYKLLATKSPKGNSGGGLKVKSIVVNDEAGAKYETENIINVDNIIGEIKQMVTNLIFFEN